MVPYLFNIIKTARLESRNPMLYKMSNKNTFSFILKQGEQIPQAFAASFREQISGGSPTYTAWWMTLDFSRRYSEIWAPTTVPPLLNLISRYFPNLLELSLMTVRAFPKASTKLFTSRIFS